MTVTLLGHRGSRWRWHCSDIEVGNGRRRIPLGRRHLHQLDTGGCTVRTEPL